MATKVSKEVIGNFDDGREVYRYVLEDEKGQIASVMNIGCAILELCIRDRNGELTDVMCGMENYETKIRMKGLAGATVGRVANRIADGRFVFNGKEIQLEKNDFAGGHIHGGRNGFQNRYWDGEIVGESVVFTYVSKDGEEGYPGDLTLKMTVTFENSVLRQETEYWSEAGTVCNLTNHSAFNLNGTGSGNTLGHMLMINADEYTINDEHAIPVKNVPVEGTPYDFREPHTIGERIDADDPMIQANHGYDVNFVLNENHPCCVITGDRSGITMTLNSTAPCMMLYTGNHMGFAFNGRVSTGKNGIPNVDWGGFSVEPHFMPNAANTDLQQILVEPGKTYTYLYEMAFSVEE
ncbi:MAG: galactose mutarotase [Oscillospiraceae bacterium]|nr:galactose mutarotase [Oscillospiraceae bacterium]